MIAYTLLGIEFLLRFYYQKPFIRESSSENPEAGSPSNEKQWKKGGAWLPPRLSLMVTGLALATLFVFLRFDASLSYLLSS